MLRTVLLPAVAVVSLGGLLLAACSHADAAAPGATASLAGTAPQDPLAAWESVRAVLQSPRCLNCHPPGEGGRCPRRRGVGVRAGGEQEPAE